MPQTGKRRTLWLLVAAGAGAAALVFLLVRMILGLRTPYQVRDHDPELARIASTARPIIAALEQEFQRTGNYPAQWQPPESGPGGWVYTATSANRAYVLSKKLSWDPMLRYECDNGTGKWVFDPGDGSPVTELRL